MERLSIVDLAVVLNKMKVSKKFAAEIVGGRPRLNKLIADGSIKTYGSATDAFNSKQRLNAWDVVRHVKARI